MSLEGAVSTAGIGVQWREGRIKPRCLRREALHLPARVSAGLP